MNRAERMHAILTQALSPSQLEIVDDSAKHAGHAGASPQGQTHYTIRIISNAFAGKSRVQTHQMIFALLDNEFKNGLHALSIDVKSS